ncbi:MAG: hypothetical protein RIC14_10100 [Filomicrobium sp.]
MNGTLGGRTGVARIYRTFVSGVVSIALAVTPTLSAFAQDITREQIEACKSQDEDSFRRAIASVTVKSLAESLKTINYKSLVDQEWRDGDVDTIIDTRVDIAIKEIREETSWGNLLKTLAYREEAQKLATEAAERVYQSEVVTKAIETLASGVGEKIGQNIEFAAKDAAQPALRCLQEYLGPRYGSTVANLVRDDARQDFAAPSGDGTANITPGSVLRQAGGGATGLAILIVRRQLANIARSIGQRIVGSVLARLVSVVAGGVGLVLIAKDIWDFRHGVLPIIETEMKSAETKDKVRQVLADTISTQIQSHVEQIGQSAADRVITVWHEFRAAHLKALELADKNTEFRGFLDTLSANRLGRLDEIVSLILPKEGEAGVLTRLENGTLSEAVTRLPDSAIQIARATRSLEKGLKWHAIAGAKTDDVVEYGIYLETEPNKFTTTSLNKLLALGDQVAVVRLAGLDAQARATLFDLDTLSLKGLARSLNREELGQLAEYLTGLQQTAREQILQTVAKEPAKLKLLARQRIRHAVLTSSDQTAAVEMMLRSNNGFSPKVTWNDMRLVLDGRVHPLLLLDKHPISLGALALMLLMALFILRRLFYSPKPRAPKSA